MFWFLWVLGDLLEILPKWTRNIPSECHPSPHFQKRTRDNRKAEEKAEDIPYAKIQKYIQKVEVVPTESKMTKKGIILFELSQPEQKEF